jgi:hypothetical protein
MGLQEEDSAKATGPAANRRRFLRKTSPGWAGWLTDPRSTVLVLLALIVGLGGGRRWLQAIRGRRAIGRLEDPGVAPQEVRAAAEHGRGALMELFRLLGTGQDPAVREAAGQALATLWARDELVDEEEMAIVRRGYSATWRARRRYPREIRARIPFEIQYGLGFLKEDGPGFPPGALEWSHRVVGTEKASLESFSPWSPGPARVAFTLDPEDFQGRGPFRLVLQTKARPRRGAGHTLSSSWELELPHLPFTFELDPQLEVNALLALADESRAEAFRHALQLEVGERSGTEPRFLPLNQGFALRDPPELVVRTPLPCDLAHTLSVEIEGIPGRFKAGSLIVSGQGLAGGSEISRRFALEPIEGFPEGAIDRPGERRLRLVLSSSPDLGWTDPDTRSVWPGEIITDWVTVRVVRL